MKAFAVRIISAVCASENRMLACALGFGLLLSLGAAVVRAASYAERTQSGIAAGVVRLHIPANSDSAEDQAVKLLVRDALLPRVNECLAIAADKAEAIVLLTEALPALEQTANDTLAANGFGYGAHASIDSAFFPSRTYGDVSLPAGPYDALRVALGDGAGGNWWCMVFPPLCFVDITQANASPALKESLDALLDADGAALVLHGDSAEVRARFWVVEAWQGLKERFKLEGKTKE